MGVRFAPLWALLAGAVSVFAHAPFEQAWLMPLTLAALFGLWMRAGRARDGALIGFAWGLGAFVAGISWLYVALNRYGGMAPPLAALAILLFCAYLALYPALAGGLFARLRRQRAAVDLPLLAALWTGAEWLRGWVFTGFPWLAAGYSQMPPSPLAGWFSVVGVYGVSACVALAAAGLAHLLLARERHSRTWALGALLLPLALGAVASRLSWVQPEGAPLSVALVQTNVEQGLKWRPDMLSRWLEQNQRAVRETDAQLVVLPETTLPLLLDLLPASYLEQLAAPLRERGGDAILGVFTRDAGQRVYNAAVSLGAGLPQHYAKRHLVPFGEYSPPLFDWFYRLVSIPMSDQTPGPARQALMQFGQQRIALNICYEDLFGEELIAALPEATLMLNLSNLAWYGDSFAQPQHLQIARARALESGRPMLRATNTGMTALIQPDGRVEAVLPGFTQGVLKVSAQGYAGLTPYARWGNAPVLIGVALVLAWSLVARRRA